MVVIFTCLLKDKPVNKQELYYFLPFNQEIISFDLGIILGVARQLESGSQASDAASDQQQAVLMQNLLGIPDPQWENKGNQKEELQPVLQGLPGNLIHTQRSLTPQENGSIHSEPVSPCTHRLHLELHSFKMPRYSDIL